MQAFELIYGNRGNSVVIGDTVGFVDRNHQQRSGRFLRLNDKTGTQQVGQQQWRVAYGLLYRVVDASGDEAREPALLEGSAAIVIKAEES